MSKSDVLRCAQHSDHATFSRLQLANCESLAPYFDDVDQPLIVKLKDVKVVRPLDDPRGATITFEFHDNDFLASNTVTKVFKPKADARELGHEEFEWSEDLVPEPCTIQWKDDEVRSKEAKPRSLV